MLDQQIITRDANVLKACQSQLRGLTTALEQHLQQMRGQLQNASSVAIDNHIRILAMRQVLENPKPLFTIFGIPIGRRSPRVEDINVAYDEIKSRFTAPAKQKPDSRSDEHTKTPDHHAPSTVEKPCA